MALKIPVKINHITNLSDARYCAGMGVDYLGFTLEKNSAYYIDPSAFAEITGWISGPEFIAEFENYTPSEIADTLQHYDIQTIEITKPEILREMLPYNKPIVLNVNIDSYTSISELEKDLESIMDLAEFIILKSDQPGLINTKNLEKLAGSYHIMAGYGISKKNILKLVHSIPIMGIALDGGQEKKVGFKDYDFLAEILELLEIDDSD
jgi:phosphoribosylanthranilate isomerase